MKLTKTMAARFILLKQGLLGEYAFTGKDGVLSYVKQAGCVQYDPIDICGRNADLVLQSRVKGYQKSDLYELLYIQRELFDYWDKNMSVISVSDWPFFLRTRTEYERESYYQDNISSAYGYVRQMLLEKGPCCSQDMELGEKVRWPWGKTRISRAALESLYFRGELAVHHKKGTQKYYDFAKKLLPNNLLSADDPNKTQEEYFAWHIKRRIGSVGMLWNKPSDAFLYIRGVNAENRKTAFESLKTSGDIVEAEIEGISQTFYLLSSDLPLLDRSLDDSPGPRCELIAPLDNMLWDRKLIEALFGFDYRWEIYNPPDKRKYGYYVIPVLYGDRFAGRIEAVNDRAGKSLVIKNFWPEAGDRIPKKAFLDCLKRFAKFNECNEIIREDGK
jgi:uncharacterized protein YcaQ